LMRDDGIYIMNVIDGGDSGYARAQLATLQEHFSNVRAIIPEGGVPTNRAANLILIASNASLPEMVVATEDGTLLDAAETSDFIDGAQVLRDDFAPVDQLAENY